LRSDRMKRREFVTLLGGALAWSSKANAQQRTLPVIGFLSAGSPGSFKRLVDAFRGALSDSGFVEGRNVAIEYRWAEGQTARLGEMADDLVRHRVSLIVTGGTVTARAAQAATSTIPILFISGPDPVRDGLVSSLSRPGGNLTGLAIYTSDLMPKRLEFLNKLVPGARTIALLVNPTDIAHAVEVQNIGDATRINKQQIVVLMARSEGDLESAFSSAVTQRADGLLISANPFFTSLRAHLIALATRHAIPTAYPWREYVEDGGLVSYGPSITEAYQLIGRYAARILKGDSPSILPVQIPKTFELSINLKAAKTLGLSVPRTILAAAANVVE